MALPSTKDGFLRYCGGLVAPPFIEVESGRQLRTDFSGIAGTLATSRKIVGFCPST